MKAMGYAQRVLTKLSLSGNTLSATAKNNGNDETDTIDLSGLSVAYASSAGNADTVDSIHGTELAKKSDPNSTIEFKKLKLKDPYSLSSPAYDDVLCAFDASDGELSKTNLKVKDVANKTDLFIHHIRFFIYRRNSGTRMAEVYLNHITNRKEEFTKYDQLFLDMLQHMVTTSDSPDYIIASGLVSDNGTLKNIIYFSAPNSSTVTISYIKNSFVTVTNFDIGNEYETSGFFDYGISYLYAF